MGGCATKPKDAEGEVPETQPAETSNDSSLVKDEAVNEVSAEGVETEKADKEATEEPLVDLSSPKGDVTNTDAQAADEPLKLVSGLGELEADVVSPSPVKTHEASSPQCTEKAALGQDKAPAEDKVAEKAEEALTSTKESVSAELKDGKDSGAKESEIEAVGSLPKDAAVPVVSA